MSRYELRIYGHGDEILKVYETNIVPWGVFVKAAALSDELKNKTMIQQLECVGSLLQSVFIGLTTEELYQADANDVMNVFTQIVRNSNNIGSKNA